MSLRAYSDTPEVMKERLAAPPREAQLLFFAFLVGFTGFLTGLPATIGSAGGEEVMPRVLASLFGSVFLFPLFLYGLAAIVRLGARVAGGKGDGPGTRHAVFFAALLGLPLAVLSAVLGWIGLPALAGQAIQIAILGAFLWLLAGTVMAAEGFAHRWKVCAVLALPFGLLILLAFLG